METQIIDGSKQTEGHMTTLTREQIVDGSKQTEGHMTTLMRFNTNCVNFIAY